MNPASGLAHGTQILTPLSLVTDLYPWLQRSHEPPETLQAAQFLSAGKQMPFLKKWVAAHLEQVPLGLQVMHEA
jgi:hypothetical protein